MQSVVANTLDALAADHDELRAEARIRVAGLQYVYLGRI
jgi:hypothetical protein